MYTPFAWWLGKLPIVHLSSRTHFPSVYRRNNPCGMLNTRKVCKSRARSRSINDTFLTIQGASSFSVILSNANQSIKQSVNIQPVSVGYLTHSLPFWAIVTILRQHKMLLPSQMSQYGLSSFLFPWYWVPRWSGASEDCSGQSSVSCWSKTSQMSQNNRCLIPGLAGSSSSDLHKIQIKTWKAPSLTS